MKAGWAREGEMPRTTKGEILSMSCDTAIAWDVITRSALLKRSEKSALHEGLVDHSDVFTVKRMTQKIVDHI